MGRSMGETANVASEIRSICHDALTAEHERDYQALGQFLLPSIWKYLACEVVVVEIRSKVGAVFHTYPAFPVENESLIFLIAHQGHMMWGKPTAATSSAMWRDWRTNAVTADIEVIHKVVSWKQRLGEGNTELDGRHCRVLKPCNHCGLMVKIGLTALSVGAVHGSTAHHSYPKFSQGHPS